MRLLQVATLGAYIGLSTLFGCAHRPKPVPLVNVDIMNVTAGEVVPFTGILFSPDYLENYLEWKADQK